MATGLCGTVYLLTVLQRRRSSFNRDPEGSVFRTFIRPTVDLRKTIRFRGETSKSGR